MIVGGNKIQDNATSRFLCIRIALAIIGIAAGFFIAQHAALAAEVLAVPGQCSGWTGSELARNVTVSQFGDYRQFTEENSAIYQFHPTGAGEFTTDTTGNTFHCEDFSVPKELQLLRNAELQISFAALAANNGEDVLVPEYSLDDGATWVTLNTIVLQGILSNATREGYTKLSLPLQSVEQLAHLRVRLSIARGDGFLLTIVMVDGVQINIEAEEKASSPNFFEALTTSLEKQIVIINQKSIDGIEILDSNGHPVSLQFVKELTSTGTMLSFEPGALLKPGRYIIRTKVKRMFRTRVQEKEFTYGVASINTTQSVYKKGEAVNIAMGVLDEQGATICDASFTLRITKPDGSTTQLGTSDQSITRSSECGPESLTTIPDYSANVIAEQVGVYTLTMEVHSASGPQMVTTQFQVNETETGSIARIAPTRINPRAPYVSTILYTPHADSTAPLVETLPANAVVRDTTPSATVTTKEGRQYIEWKGSWKSDEVYRLSYTFDAPDISPALFTLGPITVDGTNQSQWTISSDEVVRKEKSDMEFEPVAVDAADWAESQNAGVQTTQEEYSAEENVHIKAYTKGYVDHASHTPTSIEHVEVHGPDGSEKGLLHASEEFRNGTKELEILHLVPTAEFRPGQYTITTTVKQGDTITKRDQTFNWGVAAINVRRSVLNPSETTQIHMAVLDDYGRTVCSSTIHLTITNSNGIETHLSSEDGSITVNPDCKDRSVTDDPDYSAEYTVADAGTYLMEMEASSDDGPRHMIDTFAVAENLAVDIERTIFPTRIYPIAIYPVSATFRAHEDVKGMVREVVPAAFTISDMSDGGHETPSSGDTSTKYIEWNVDWKKGESYTLRYTFNAPDVSPLLFRLGAFEVLGQDGSRVSSESRQWQIASDATKTWDGGGTTAAWSECANWNNNTCPANTGDDIVFDGTSNDAADWDTTSTVTSVNSITVTSMSGSFTMTKTPVTVAGNFSHTSTGDVIFTSSAAISVAGDFTLTTSGTFTGNTSTLTMTGTGGKNFNSAKTFPNLTIDPSSAGTINIVTNNPSISATLTVAAGDTLDINASRTLTHTGATVSNSGTIQGSGKLTFTGASGGPSAGGTINVLVRFDATGVSVPAATFDARTYGGGIEFYSNSTSARTVTFSTGTYTSSGNFILIADNSANLTVTGATNDPTVNITGNIDYTGVGAGNEIIATGGSVANTWTVSGNIDLTGGTLTVETGNTMKMDGVGKTLTAAGQSFYILTLDPSSTGTITVSGSDVTATNTLSIAANDTLSIDVSRTVTLTGATLTLTGTISGAGTFVYGTSTAFPSTGTINCYLKVDTTTSGNQTFTSRTYGGSVELYNNSAASGRTITLGSGTLAIAGSFYLTAPNTRDLIVTGVTNAPTVNITGDIDYLGAGVGNESLTTGAGAWTVGGNVDFTNGSFTASASNVFKMNGTGGKSIVGGFTFVNFTVDPSSADTITLSSGTLTVSTLLTVETGDTFSLASGSIAALSATSGTTLTLNGTISGSGTLTYATSTNFPTSGTISSVLRFDATGTAQTIPARTFGGDVEFYNNSAASARTFTLGTAGSQTLTFSGGFTINAANTQNATVSGATNNPVVQIAGTLDYTGVGAGTESITTGTGTWRVSTSIDMSGGTFTATTGNTFLLNGTGSMPGLISSNFYNLTIDGNGTTVTIDQSMAVTNTFTVGGLSDLNNDTVSIDSTALLTTAATGTINILGSGTDTITGDGVLVVRNSTLGTSGVLSCITRFNAASGDITMPARTYNGVVQIQTIGINTHQVIMDSGTFTMLSDLTINGPGDGDITLEATTNDPTVNISGDLDFIGVGAGAEILQLGSGTWTVSGNVDLTDGTFSAESGNTIVMNGSSKTLTSGGNTVASLTLSGTITLANETHTVSGNLSMAGGTITAGTSNVTMTGTSNTLTPGTGSLYDLTIDPASTGTITLQTSDLTISNTLSIAASDTLSINSGRTLTHTGSTLTLNGTISGAGRLVYQSSSAFPTSGVISSILRFDSTNNDQTMSNRTYGGDVEIYNNSGSNARTIVMSAGTHTLSGAFSLMAQGSQDVVLDGATNNPTVDLTGTLDFTGTGGGSESISSGTGTWTISGDVDFTGGTFTATSGNTFIMNGAGGKNITAPSTTFSNFTANPTTATSIFVTTSSFSIAGTLTVGGVADGITDTFSIGSGLTVTSTSTGTVTIIGSGDDAIDGLGTLIIQNSNLGTAGTIATPVIFDATGGNLTSPNRSYAGGVTMYNNDGSNARTVTMAAGTHAFLSTLTLQSANGQTMTLSGSNNPTVNITGNLAGTAGGGSEAITSGTGTWTIAGDVDLASVAYTATSGNVLKMSGTGGKTITGGNTTLYDFTVDPTSTATIAVQTSGFIVSHTLSVANNDTFSIPTGINITVSGISGTTLTLNTSGTLSGAGRIIYKNPAADFPVTGTVNCVVRFESTPTTHVSIPERVYGSDVEPYINSNTTGSSTVTLGTGAGSDIVINGDLILINDDKRALLVDGVSISPTMTIAGDIDVIKNGVGSVTYAPTASSTTVSGNVDLTDGILDTSNSGDFIMDGTANLIGNGQTFGYLRIDGAGTTVTVTGSDVLVSADLIIGGAGDSNNDTLSIGSGRTLTSTATGTVSFENSGTDSISGAGTLIVQNSSLDTDGTLSTPVRFDGTGGNITEPARTYGANVEMYNNSGSSARTITMSAGTHTFSGALTLNAANSQNITLSGSANNPTIALTGDLDFTGVGGGFEAIVSGTGVWTVSGNVDLTGGTYTATSGNTMKMNGTSKTITSASQSFSKFEVSGGTIANADALDVNSTFDVSGTGTFTAATEVNMNVAGNFTIASGASFTGPTGAGTLIFDGDLTATDNTAVKQNQGNVQIGTSPDTTNLGSDMAYLNLTIASGDVLNTNGYDPSIAGNLVVNGTLDTIDDVETDETTINASGSVTFNSTATFVQDQSTLLMKGASGTKDLITDGAFSLYNLTLNDSGGSLVVEVEDALDVDHNLTITGGTLDAKTSEGNPITVGGNWTNNDIFTNRSNTVTLDGSAQQTVAGTLTGSSKFYNLIITNNSGSDPDSSPSVIFSAAATTENTFTAATANTKIRFNVSSTYTFQNIVFNGQATGTRVFLRSSSPSTQWNINVAGTRSVSYTNVKDSNACGQAPDIDASDGTNIDSGNNTCWTFAFLTFSISDTTIGFGTLSTSAARWATGDTNGNASDTAAHTLSIATSAASGYVITYYGATLTSGGNTIDAADIDGVAGGTPGSEQFAMSASTGGDATIATDYLHTSNNFRFIENATTTMVSESGPTTTENISVYYLGNISPVTAQGSYSTSITFIATGSF